MGDKILQLTPELRLKEIEYFHPTQPPEQALGKRMGVLFDLADTHWYSYVVLQERIGERWHDVLVWDLKWQSLDEQSSD